MPEGFYDAFFEIAPLAAKEVGKEVVLEAEPEAFDRIEVGTVNWEILGLEMVPVQGLGTVPTGVVQYENLACARLRRILLGKSVEEHLEDLGVAMTED